MNLELQARLAKQRQASESGAAFAATSVKTPTDSTTPKTGNLASLNSVPLPSMNSYDSAGAAFF
jgi:hypothetical protein